MNHPRLGYNLFCMVLETVSIFGNIFVFCTVLLSACDFIFHILVTVCFFHCDLFYLFRFLFVSILCDCSGITCRCYAIIYYTLFLCFRSWTLILFTTRRWSPLTMCHPPLLLHLTQPYAVAMHISPPIARALQADPALLNAAVRCVTGSKAPGTVRGYSRTLQLFQEFCAQHRIPYPDFSAQDVIQYVLHLDSNAAPFSLIATVKPAIQFLEQTLDRATIFSGAVNVVLEGARRRTEKRRGPREKAPVLSRSDVITMLSKLYLPFAQDLRVIPEAQFRTIFRVVIVYHTACRFDCFSRLQACDFDLAAENIAISFPSSKNDQHHRGNISYLAASPSPLCPEKITNSFFRGFGLLLGRRAGDRSFLNFQSRCAGGHVIRLIFSSLSYQEATKNLRSTFAAASIQTRATDKSVKMLAVTTAFASGATSDQVMHLGRWQSAATPDHYQVNSKDFKVEVSKFVPALFPLH